MTTPWLPSMMTISPPLTSRGDIAQPDDGRNAHGAGDDRRVAGPPAGIGGKTLDVLAIQRRRLARQQIVGDDHDIAGQMQQDPAAAAPIRRSQHLPLDIVNILHALGEIPVGHLRENAGVFSHHRR